METKIAVFRGKESKESMESEESRSLGVYGVEENGNSEWWRMP